MNDLYSAMTVACRDIGLFPPDALPDSGKWAEADVDGDPHGKGDGRIKLFLDGEGGIVHNWKTAEQKVFFAGNAVTLTSEQKAARHQARETARILAEAELQRERDAAAAKAMAIYNAGGKEVASHPYAVKKKQVDFGPLVRRGAWIQRGWPDALLVPIYGADGKLRTLEAINADGVKDFLKGGEKRGGFYPFGKLRDAKRVLVGEGMATVAAGVASTGLPAVAAMDCGNLLPVAQEIRKIALDAEIIIVADNDIKADGSNPGLTAATAAALVVGGKVAVPTMGKACDMWDLWHEQGAEVVAGAIAGAAAPARREYQPGSGDVQARDPDAWPEPLPLPKLPPVPEFPLAILPDAMQAWAADAADRARYRPDFFAVAAMTALGSVVGRKIGIRMKSQDDWTEYANVWAAIVGDPSALKSPAKHDAMIPLKGLQVVADEEHADAMQLFEVEEETYKLRRDAKRKKAVKNLSKDASTEINLGEDAAPETPPRRTYWTSDVNDASLSEILVVNPNGLLIERDELSSLLSNLEDEKQASLRGMLLSGWSGKEGFRSDRIMRGITYIPKYALSVFGGIQPGPLMRYVRGAFSGERADGLLQRFQLIVWPDPQPFEYVDRWPNKSAKEAANELFKFADTFDADAIGSKDAFGNDPPFLRFSPDAQEMFSDWYTHFMQSSRGANSENISAPLASHFGKYSGLVGKLSLIIHVADDGQGKQISARTLTKALAWLQYLTPHAHRVYHAAQSPETGAAELLLSRIKRKALPAAFKAWEISRNNWHGLTDREAVKKACRLLREYGWLIEIEAGGSTGGRPADPVYAVSPAAGG